MSSFIFRKMRMRRAARNVAPGQANADYGSPAAAAADVTSVAHLFGIPASFPERRTDVVIEDGAQALGAEFDGRKVGTIGAVGVFSLGATKVITAGGQGGMLVSRNREIVGFARAARDYDVPVDSHPRFNVQMTDLQAAVGRVQLRRLPFLIERRERIFQRYRGADVELLEPVAPASRPVRYRAVMRAGSPSDARRRFAARGVKTIVPIADEESLASPQQVPHAATLSRSTLSLPIFPALSDREVERVAQGLASAE